jgi:ubiquitin conjugation factor E4 B
MYKAHRETLERTSRDETSNDFEKFIQTVISDSIFLLDENLKALSTIRKLEFLRSNHQNWTAMTQAERDAKEKELTDAEGLAKYYCKMASSTFKLLALVAKQISHAFTTEMFAGQFAQMIDFYIYRLTGQKFEDIDVQHPERYSFRPKELLRDVRFCGNVC